MPYKFKCPYCFGECEDSKVYFRATVSYDDRQLRELRSTGKDQLVELKARFTKYNARSEEVEKLIKFWEDKGGEAGYQTDAGWNMPYIDPEQDDFGLLIRDFQTGNYKVGSDGFVRDEDGFVRRVIDRFGSEFKPMKRLCPHCLNPLPLEDYGKYKTKFISVVGTTGAGKTVYLYQLLHNFQAIMRAAGCHVGAGNLDDLGEHVDPNFPLPGATDSRLMRRPLAVNLEKPNGEKLTLVFYDVAGEHFAEKTEMDSTLQEGSGVTSYIRNCDAMMLLIDPVQIRALAPGGHTMRAEDVQKTVTQIQKIRSTWQEVPTAVVLTKSDNPEVVNQFPPTAMFLQNIGGNQQGFQRDEFVEVNRELRSFISSNATNTYSTIEGAMTNTAYFAVSAITCGVIQKFEKYGELYQLSGENAKKLFWLKEWVDKWNETMDASGKFLSEEDIVRKRHLLGAAPSQLSCGIPENKAITDEFARTVETDIQGERVSFGKAVSYTLNLEEVRTISLIGYPSGNPNPRRVEEPLQWILWKMGQIEPEFCAQPEPSQPRTGFAMLFHRDNDPAWTTEWNQATEEARQAFYRGEADYQRFYDQFRKKHNM